MHRALFLGEGSSDQAISVHIERIAQDCGVDIWLTAPDAELLPVSDRSVAGKLLAAQRLGGSFDVVLIHRDADGAGRAARVAEIRAAMQDVMPEVECVPVIPIRMTEAWLLLDEGLIREVAGNPNGRVRLAIPSPREAERIADPKSLLKELIATASELTGRRRKSLQAAFAYNRRRLLEQLDPGRPVRKMESWRQFQDDVTTAFNNLA